MKFRSWDWTSGLDSWLVYLHGFRCVICQGAWGSGKTAVAVEVALRLRVRGHVNWIVSNVPLVFTPVAQITVAEVPLVTDAAVIMDEGWMYLESGEYKRAKNYIAFLRKRRQYLIVPSVMNVTSYLKWLTLERSFNGLPMGVPIWRYRWAVYGTDKEVPRREGSVNFMFPQRVFQFFDSTAEPEEGVFYVY